MEAHLDQESIWFPLAFVEDLDPHKPTSISVYDRPLVLFRDLDQHWTCLLDRCPHRLAKLSDGRVDDGRIECLYHGWQFDSSGRCAHIPQLKKGSEPPNGAHLRPFRLEEVQGMLWVWLGDPDSADSKKIPTVAALDQPGTIANDFVMDLPYDQSFLVENVLDVAHIHIAHDGMRAGGSREYALPLEFEFKPDSVDGITARYRSIGLHAEGAPALNMAKVELRGPNLVFYESDYADPTLCSGLALYCLPLGSGRCRLLYRSYSNFWPAKERRVPRWFKHGVLCELLEQDMNVVTGQSAWIDHMDGELKDNWLPIKSSDALVIRYRKWLDQYGSDLPDHLGFGTSTRTPATINGGADSSRQRFSQHTQHCSACAQAHARFATARNLAMPMMLALLLALALTAPYSSGSLLALVLAGGAATAGATAWFSTVMQRRLEEPTQA